MLRLLGVLLLCAGAASAADPARAPVGCAPVAAEPVPAERFAAEVRPLARGEGLSAPKLTGRPGVAWDLGAERTARLSVYLTRECRLGLTASVASGGESSSPDLDAAVADFARRLAADAPDWSFSVVPPSVMRLSKDGTVHSTDLRRLLDVRLAAATPLTLGGEPVRVLYDGWLLFIVPQDASKSLNLSVRAFAHPWASYDLTPYGLPRLVARFDADKAVLWALP